MLGRMADLNLGPQQSSGQGKSIAIAAVAMAAIAAGIYFFAPRGTIDIKVTKTNLVAPHVENRAMSGGIKVLGTPASSEDTLYVAADLHIANGRSVPLYIAGETVKVNFADGSDVDATIVTPADFPRIEPSFPDLVPLLQHPLPADASVPGKGSMDGTVLFVLPGYTADAWKSKKSATMVVLLAHGDQQTVALP